MPNKARGVDYPFGLKSLLFTFVLFYRDFCSPPRLDSNDVEIDDIEGSDGRIVAGLSIFMSRSK